MSKYSRLLIKEGLDMRIKFKMIMCAILCVALIGKNAGYVYAADADASEVKWVEGYKESTYYRACIGTNYSVDMKAKGFSSPKGDRRGYDIADNKNVTECVSDFAMCGAMLFSIALFVY